MYKKVFIVALGLLLISGMTGCARENVRHLVSDVSLVSPGTTKKQEVLNYLGQPDAEYKMDGGDILWVYYEEILKASILQPGVDPSSRHCQSQSIKHRRSFQYDPDLEQIVG